MADRGGRIEAITGDDVQARLAAIIEMEWADE